jgi:hypothetical protein
MLQFPQNAGNNSLLAKRVQALRYCGSSATRVMRTKWSTKSPKKEINFALKYMQEKQLAEHYKRSHFISRNTTDDMVDNCTVEMH